MTASSPNPSLWQYDEEIGGDRGTGGEIEICSPGDAFDIPLKNPSVDRLRRWRQAALVLNASRRYRYTLDLEKEKEKEQIRRKIRAHAQAIRQAYTFDLKKEDEEEQTRRLVTSTTNAHAQVIRDREETSTFAAPTGVEHSATTEELKQATKFSYFATALAGGGIVSLLIFHLENKSGKPHTLFFKALTFFVLATFASGLSIILFTICAPSASYQMQIIRGLVSATFVFLALMGVGVSIALMKATGELAFVPAIVVVIIACIIVYYKKTVRSS